MQAAVLGVFGKSVKGCGKFFYRLCILLYPCVEARPFKDDLATRNEIFVKSFHHNAERFAVLTCEVEGARNVLSLVTQDVQQGVDLVFFRLGTEARRGAKAIEALLPFRP